MRTTQARYSAPFPVQSTATPDLTRGLTVLLSYDRWDRSRALSTELQVRQAGLPAAGRPGEGGRGVGRGAARRAAAVDPSARRGAARQPQHRRQGLRRAREPARDRDHRRQGLLRPRRQLAVPQGRAPQARWPQEIDDAVVQAHHLQVAQRRVPPRSPKNGSTRSSRSGRAPRAGMTPMNTDTPAIEIRDLVRRYGRTDAVNGLNLRVAAGALLRLLRPQRRRQDDDDQVPAEPAAADERRGAASSASTRRGTRSPSSRGSPTCPTTSRSIRG